VFLSRREDPRKISFIPFALIFPYEQLHSAVQFDRSVCIQAPMFLHKRPGNLILAHPSLDFLLNSSSGHVLMIYFFLSHLNSYSVTHRTSEYANSSIQLSLCQSPRFLIVSFHRAISSHFYKLVILSDNSPLKVFYCLSIIHG
jgi:hypothetical protein